MLSKDEVSRCPLTTKEQLNFLDTIEALENVCSADEFTAWLDNEMQRVLPHRALVCWIGTLSESNSHKIRHLLLLRFPRTYLDHLRQPDGSLSSPLLNRWGSLRAPVLVDFKRHMIKADQAWIDHVTSYRIRNFAAHGLPDLHGGVTSYFCFTDVLEPLEKKHIYLLSLLIPHLHLTLVRASTTLESVAGTLADAAPPVNLTQRQKDILHYLSLGKTNPEIAQLLRTSQNNIKYHLCRIFAKLDAVDRAQAIAKAVTMKLIDL